MIRTIRGVRARIRDETAASAVEYALLISLIAAAIIVTVGALGLKLPGMFTIEF